MDSLELSRYMQKYSFRNVCDGFKKLVRYLNVLPLKLPQVFWDDRHKTRYLRRAVMSLDWAQQPASQIKITTYTFV